MKLWLIEWLLGLDHKPMVPATYPIKSRWMKVANAVHSRIHGMYR